VEPERDTNRHLISGPSRVVLWQSHGKILVDLAFGDFRRIAFPMPTVLLSRLPPPGKPPNTKLYSSSESSPGGYSGILLLPPRLGSGALVSTPTSRSHSCGLAVRGAHRQSRYGTDSDRGLGSTRSSMRGSRASAPDRGWTLVAVCLSILSLTLVTAPSGAHSGFPPPDGVALLVRGRAPRELDW